MGSPYADLERPPLRAAALSAALVGSDLWRDVRVVESTASTNADLAAEARAGAPEGWVLVAESQTGGRGRLGRSWSAPPRSGLTFSVLLRPYAPASTWSWLPLLTGVALVEAVRERTGVDVALKWPNDLLAADGGKLAGILAEVVPGTGAVVLGIGLNVTTRAAELARLPHATSLALQGATSTDRDPLLRAVLRAISGHYRSWAAGGAAMSSYAEVCATIGASVRVQLPRGDAVIGTATGVDQDGRLLVRSDTGRRYAFSAGDVEHLR